MTNKEIATAFNELAQLMELHGENQYKIRSYQSAYRLLRAMAEPVAGKSEAELQEIKGVGKAIAQKIRQLAQEGKMNTLEKYREQTPPGVQEMIKVKGFGPKKIRVIWKELGAESLGEVLYACNENRLVELKGFGKKTQEDLASKISYFLNSKGTYHYATLEKAAQTVLEKIKKQLKGIRVEETGAFRRRMLVAEAVEILIGNEDLSESFFQSIGLSEIKRVNQTWEAKDEAGVPFKLSACENDAFGSSQLMRTGPDAFVEQFKERASSGEKDWPNVEEEKSLFANAQLPFIAPELRDEPLYLSKPLPELIDEKDLKGVLHVHSTYSDGAFSLEEMALHVKNLGYEYLGITDHSKSAFYANGLQPERLLQQFEEIESLNEQLNPFRIFKGIESDILADGSLDYDEELLDRLDFVIASIHSNLKMDIEKATNRLIKAIENPYTTILGHPTGRLLLSRPAYPIDHRKVIDACAANGVVIELNANPYRLDIDWQWLPYAIEKKVLIAINPDAHSKSGVNDLRYGILAARKGGLEAGNCLNAYNLEEFEAFLKAKKDLTTH